MPAGIQIHLELDLQPDCLSGAVLLDDGSRREFSGWLELVALVEELRPGPMPNES